MERLLRVTNVLLAIIALCLVLLVLNVYRVDVVADARAQTFTYGDAKPVYLVYRDASGNTMQLVQADGKVPTK